MAANIPSAMRRSSAPAPTSTAMLQVRYGVNAWPAFALGHRGGRRGRRHRSACLSFRSGLRGSYFALVTLAFAEVLRILASVAPITGAGVGTLIKLDLGRADVPVRRAGRRSTWLILALVAIALCITRWHRALALRRAAGGGARERRRGARARRRRDSRQARAR